jgi:hypothetical protein
MRLNPLFGALSLGRSAALGSTAAHGGKAGG